MPAPTITALPTAPSRTDEPAVFVTLADAFVEALGDLPTEINAFGSYLDGLGLDGTSWKGVVRCATTANHGLSGLTAIDGVTPVAGDRVLVKSNTAPAENGIWVAASGAWARATDADTGAELVGLAVIVSEGTANGDQLWYATTNAPITIGSTSLTFAQFSGSGYAPGGTDVAVADGGTGSSTAAGARSNLGTAASGAVTTSDITMSTARLLGRTTASTGAIEEISVGGSLTLSGGVLSAGAATSGRYEALGSAVPTLSQFAWVNQGTASAADGIGALIWTVPAVGSANLRILKMAAPSAPFSLYSRIEGTAAFTNAVGVGIALRNSSDGKLIIFYIQTNGSAPRLLVERWTDHDSFSASTFTGPSVWVAPRWLRCDVTSTTLTFYTSFNGWDWAQISTSETIATFIGTVDEIGLVARADNGASTYFVSVFQTTAPA